MISAGGMLPAVRLQTAMTGEMQPLRQGHGPLVLVAVHPGSCELCQRFVRDLSTVTEQVEQWRGRVIVVLPGAVENVPAFQGAIPLPFRILLDPEGTLASGGAAVMIADEWGEVYFVANAAAGHALPAPREITEWVQFLAIQCPECEPPEGAWRKPVDLA